MQLRPYQIEAHNATVDFVQNENGHGIIAACPRSGKSLLMARIAEYLLSHGCRVLALADRGRLLTQNESKYTDLNNVGMVSNGLGRAEYDKPIVIGGIQTVYNKTHLLGERDWIIIDECHGVSNNVNDTSRYRQLLRQYPNARILGYSGTPWNLTEGALNWGKIIYEITYQQLLAGGYCVPLTNKVKDEPDLSTVAHSGAEYNLESLGEYMCQSELIEKAARKAAEYIRANNRKKTIGFCVNLRHAFAMCMAMKHLGFKVDMVSGDMDEVQKDMHYHDFEHGDTEVMFNVEIMTKGVDFPCTDCIIFLRPTESMGLWEQAMSRGIGLFDGKKECALLDFTGNLRKFGTLGNPIWKYFGSEKKKVGKALKCCPACEEAVNIGRETCNHCGYIFLKEDIIKELKHEAEADTKSDMSKAKSAERIYTIGYIDYSEHTSQKGGISMKVTYHSGRFSCNQFVPFGNPNYYSKKRVQEFMRGRSNVIPATLESALAASKGWRQPKIMEFRLQQSNPKYFEPSRILEWQESEKT